MTVELGMYFKAILWYHSAQVWLVRTSCAKGLVQIVFVRLLCSYLTPYLPPTYPLCSAPLLSLEDPYGLSPDQVKELQDTINKMAADRVGEVSGRRVYNNYRHCY